MNFWKPATLLGAASFALSMGLSNGAIAQVSAAANSDQLEEVIVTAEKRAVNLQKVPESIQVKQGEDLRKQGKKRIDEIMQGTVGIQAQDSQVGVTFFVRGVDSSAGMGGVVAVPVLIDGVAQARSESVRGGTLDLGQAEIMRGPQSTTLGANALAGAISLVSNQPVLNQVQGNGTLEYGDFGKRSMEGVFNAPLGDTTALRVAYSSDKRLGYISAGAGDTDLRNVRAKLRWQPTDNLNSVFTVSQQDIGGNGVQQGVLLSYGYWHPVTPGSAAAAGITTSACASSLPNVTLMGCPATFYTDGTGPDFRHRADPWNDGFPPNSFPNGPYRDTKITQASEQIDWTTGIGTLTVLPSVQFAHFLSREPPRGGSFMEQDEKETTPTVDVHLNSLSGGKLTWTTGLYYSRDKIYNSWFGNVNYPGTYGPGLPGPQPAAAANCTDPSLTCFDWDNTPLTLRTSKSAYANGEFSILDTLRLVAGVRYSKDDAEGTAETDVPGSEGQPDVAAEAAATSFSGSASWSHTTYRGGFEYDVVPGTMLYATYSTGYTPGAFTVSAGAMGPPGVSANPATTLKQISIGWKSQFLDNRLQLNGDLFDTTFYNRGVEGTINYETANGVGTCANSLPPGPPPNLTISACGPGYLLSVGQNDATDPELNSKGIDLDSTWLITANDRLAVTYEYLKTAYKALPVITGNPDYSAAGVQALAAQEGVTISAADAAALSAGFTSTMGAFVGSQLQNAPVNSFTLDYSHLFRLPGGSQLTPLVAAVYKTKYWSFGGAPGANVSQILADSSSSDLAWQQSYLKLDLSLDWQSADGKFDINYYVKNATNKVVLANFTGTYVSLEAPRMIGVVFNAHL